MELKAFVAETLSQIIEGVRSAQAKLKDSGGSEAVVNPPVRSTVPAEFFGPLNLPVVRVKFAVNLTVSESKSKKGGLKVAAAVLSVGGSAETGAANTSATTIRFQVPIVLPGSSFKAK